MHWTYWSFEVLREAAAGSWLWLCTALGPALLQHQRYGPAAKAGEAPKQRRDVTLYLTTYVLGGF